MFSRQRPVSTRTPDPDLSHFRATYEALHGRPLQRCSDAQWREERRNLKRLRALVPDDEERRAFLEGYARLTEPFVVDHGHLLRYALVEWRYHKLLHAAQAGVAAERSVVPYVPPVPRGPSKRTVAWFAARGVRL